VDLQIQIPDQPNPLRVKGEIVWSRCINPDSKSGKLFDMGIRFVEINPEDKQVIRSVSPEYRSGKDN
jgi:Tfp pilus assembly protein PilZ